MSFKKFSFRVAAAHSNIRLDVFLFDSFACYSRSYLTALVRDGNVFVNGVTKKPSYKVMVGEIVSGIIKNDMSSFVLAESVPLKIVYEDSDIIVINKKAGIVVHPVPGKMTGTVLNALLYRYPDLRYVDGKLRNGIVHRLDKDTSGLLVVARNNLARLNIMEQFRNRKVGKLYKTLVYRTPPGYSGIVDVEIGKDDVNNKRMVVNAKKNLKTITKWQILEKYDGLSLIKVIIETGRTHQIRLHFKLMGCPIVGDSLYNDPSLEKWFLKQKNTTTIGLIKSVKRQMLHACKLSIKHPVSNKYLNFETQLPKDMLSLIKKLRICI